MIPDMKRYVTLALTATVCWTVMFAQNDVLPSRSMTIEGTYNPSMTNEEKVMPVPAKQKNEKEQATVSYLTDPNPFENTDRSPMSVFSQSSDQVHADSLYGLARLGYGLRNVYEGLFDIGWIMTDRDVVKASGSMDGWNSKPDGDWRSRMFNSRLAAEYEHRFDRFVIGLKTDFGFSRHNYMPGVAMDSAMLAASNLFIKTKEGSLSGYIQGRFRDDIKYHLEGGGQWLIRDGLNLNGTERSNKEGIIRISAGAEKPISTGTVSVDYRQKSTVYRWWGLNGCEYDGFTNLTFTPMWHYNDGIIKTDLGFNMDIRTGAGKPFLMSPMATLSYNFENELSLLAGLTGGLREYDMRTLSRISPYWSEKERIKDGYDVVDLYAGLAYNHDTWLSVSGKLGYRHTIDEIFQNRADSLIVTSVFLQQSSDVFYVRLDADMQFSDRAFLRMDVTYNNYLGKYLGHKMDLKPAFDANLFGRLNIARGLDAMLSYRLMVFHWVGGVSMPTVNDLSVTMDYDFRDNLSFYATLKNLAGGDFYYYAGYRCLKPSVLLGATYRF